MCCCLCLAALGGSLAAAEATSVSKDVNNAAAKAKQNAANIVDKIKGRNQEPIHDILVRYQLPPGLLPKDVLRYTFDETRGELVVKLSNPCEVKYSSGTIIRFDTEVRGTLGQGVWSITHGMKIKAFTWSAVKSIYLDSSDKDKVVFDIGTKTKKPRKDFVSARIAVNVFTF